VSACPRRGEQAVVASYESAEKEKAMLENIWFIAAAWMGLALIAQLDLDPDGHFGGAN
jgi:hypothetical protein